MKSKLIIAYSDFLFQKKMCQLADLSQGCIRFYITTHANRDKISKNKNYQYPVSGFRQVKTFFLSSKKMGKSDYTCCSNCIKLYRSYCTKTRND